MLISEKLATAISAQVGREFEAMLQYLSVASYFDRESLPQLAARFYDQSEEEKMHAMKLTHYVTDAGGMLTVPAIEAPKSEPQSAEEAVRLSLSWELEVANQINDLVRIAMEKSDFLAQNFLQWFVDEQLEEVNTMKTLLRTVQRAGDNLLQVEAFIARQPAPGAG